MHMKAAEAVPKAQDFVKLILQELSRKSEQDGTDLLVSKWQMVAKMEYTNAAEHRSREVQHWTASVRNFALQSCSWCLPLVLMIARSFLALVKDVVQQNHLCQGSLCGRSC